jgi:cobaltochelatase CobN
MRSRVLNPKWIKGMRRHGYKGAFEMAASVDYLFAYDATTDLIQDYQYEQVTDTYLLNPENHDFLQANNPDAMKEMTERLIEAMQRGLWNEPNAYQEKLENLLMDIEALQEMGTVSK